MTQSQIRQLARKAADEAIQNLSDYDYGMYGDEEDAIYSVSGLADEILDIYYEEYENRKPTASLFSDIAFEIAS